MSNTITIELCAEDRARLDRLTAALEKNATPDNDPLKDAALKLLANASNAESPKNATEADEKTDLTTTPKTEEKPTEEKPAKAQDAQKLRAEVRSLVVRLSAKGKKTEARAATIEPYGVKLLTDIPEDKLAEVHGKLSELWAQVEAEG